MGVNEDNLSPLLAEALAAILKPIVQEAVKEAMRAIVLEGWDWATILTGVWVAGAMLAVLLTATTWMYRRQTA